MPLRISDNLFHFDLSRRDAIFLCEEIQRVYMLTNKKRCSGFSLSIEEYVFDDEYDDRHPIIVTPRDMYFVQGFVNESIRALCIESLLTSSLYEVVSNKLLEELGLSEARQTKRLETIKYELLSKTAFSV